LVLDVYVGRRMVVVPHTDDDAEKHRQNRLGQFLLVCLAGIMEYRYCVCNDTFFPVLLIARYFKHVHDK
jgi:hypothetical protein